MKISVSGVRGIFCTDLTLQHVLDFSRAFSKLLTKDTCVLARDTRASGRIISEVVSAALMEQGIDVRNLGIAPTPFAFREARKLGAGLIVTASHNPLDWNGLKFVLDGRGIFQENLQMLTRSLSHASGFEGRHVGKESSIRSDYMEELSSFIGIVDGKPAVAVDPTGGAACGHAGTILSRIGCHVNSINDVHGSSSRSPDPTTDELSDLRNLVLRSRCDAGFALDLDGDRLVVVDSEGKKMDPDTTLLLCISRAIEMGEKEIVVSVDTSDAVSELADANNCRVTYSKVGEANVTSVMLQKGIHAGGEGSSGGFVMGNFNLCRDGLLAAALIAGMLRNKGFQECMQLASRYHLIRSKIAIESSLHTAIVDDIIGYLENDCSSVDHLDGAKGIFDDRSWVLIRSSNTEESIRVSVQSSEEQRARSLFRRYELKIREAYEKVKRARNN